MLLFKKTIFASFYSRKQKQITKGQTFRFGTQMDRALCYRKKIVNDNYKVRRINTNETQFLHRIRLKQFVSNTS